MSRQGEVPVLEAQCLKGGYGAQQVLDGLDLRLRPQSALGLIGANGAGKSTTLLALVGSLPSRSGTVRLDGQKVRRWRPESLARDGLVMVPQDRGNVLRTLTVAENLRLAAGSVPENATDEGLALFPRLRERHAQRAGTLSGGEQQMLAIALGLTLQPRVLLIDEPSAGLAPALLDEIVAALHDLRARGLAMIVAEQRMSLVEQLCDDVLVVNRGRATSMPNKGLRSK